METGQTLSSEQDSYTLEEKIGEGGFGVTWGASRASDGSRVVLKQLRLDRLDDWKSMELFEREARVLRELDHPHIVGYVDEFTVDDTGSMVLVQRYVEGATLVEIMREGRPLDAHTMARWFQQMLDVCAYLHGLSPPVIHRDISPKNIILSEDGRATLIDFGTVQAALRSANSISSTSAGTFGYASMEQMIGRAIPQSDLYGLGMTFIAVATGKHPEDLPFKGSRVDVRAALENSEHDARLRLALEEMTHPDADSRPESARKLLERLQPLWDAIDDGVGDRDDPLPLPRATPPSEEVDKEAVKDEPKQEDRKSENVEFIEEKIDEAELERITREELEPWLEARARCARLAKKDALGAPPHLDKNLEFERIAVDPSGRWLVLCTYYAGYAFHLATGDAHRLFLDSRSEKFCMFSPDGTLLLVGEGYEGLIRSWDVSDDALTPREDMHVEGDFGGYAAMALSPDNKLLALSGSWESGIYELDGLTKIQEISEGTDAKHLEFTPDGGALVIVDEDENLRELASGGESEALENGAITYSKDGRLCVVADTHDYEIRVRIFAANKSDGDPFKEHAKPITTLALEQDDFKPYTTHSVHLAERDKTCVVVTTQDDPYRMSIGLFDVETGAYKGRLGNIFRADGDINDGADFYVAVSDLGDHLFVSTWDQASLVTDEDDTTVMVFSLKTREHLGFIRGLKDETRLQIKDDRDQTAAIMEGAPSLYKDGVEDVIPYYATIEGIFWFPMREEPLTKSAYEQREPTLARLFHGERVPDGADERTKDRILDLRARILMGQERVHLMAPPKTMKRYLEQTRGITYLLPLIAEEALKRADQAPSFGNVTSSAASFMNQVVAVAEEYNQRPEDEREVLFEQMQETLARMTRENLEHRLEARNAKAREQAKKAQEELARKKAAEEAAKIEERARQEAEKMAREQARREQEKRAREHALVKQHHTELELGVKRDNRLAITATVLLVVITLGFLMLLGALVF